MSRIVRGKRIWMQDDAAPDPEPVSNAYERIFAMKYDPDRGTPVDEGDCTGVFFEHGSERGRYVLCVHGSYYEIYTGCKRAGVI